MKYHVIRNSFPIPRTSDKDTVPDAGSVMTRVIILRFIFAKTLSTPTPQHLKRFMDERSAENWNPLLAKLRNQNSQQIEQLRRIGLWNAMEDQERVFMEAEITEIPQQKFVEANWLCESIFCLYWALGYISEMLAYDQRADPKSLNKLPVTGSVKNLIQNAKLMPLELIEKERDLAELWHWRSRTRQLLSSGQAFSLPQGLTIDKVLELASDEAAKNGIIPPPIKNDFPAFCRAYRDLTDEQYSLASSIAMERHRAFNWLCGFAPENRWSETPTDT